MIFGAHMEGGGSARLTSSLNSPALPEVSGPPRLGTISRKACNAALIFSLRRFSIKLWFALRSCSRDSCRTFPLVGGSELKAVAICRPRAEVFDGPATALDCTRVRLEIAAESAVAVARLVAEAGAYSPSSWPSSASSSPDAADEEADDWEMYWTRAGASGAFLFLGMVAGGGISPEPLGGGCILIDDRWRGGTVLLKKAGSLAAGALVIGGDADEDVSG